MHCPEHKEEFICWMMLAVAVLSLIVAMWVTAPTEEDIQRCMVSSNYSYARCAHELGL